MKNITFLILLTVFFCSFLLLNTSILEHPSEISQPVLLSMEDLDSGWEYSYIKLENSPNSGEGIRGRGLDTTIFEYASHSINILMQINLL